MAESFDKKDPRERYALKFDFTETLGDTLTDAQMTVEVLTGEDPNPENILDGAYQFFGGEVRQRVKAGVPDCKYLITCWATNGTEDFVLVGALPVKTAR